ncbi:MAG: TetR/AcrR family transcriptional regulator, partial [Nocardioides sp.]|nr:TetR/AcrR family transcriptional regulator [Nocardioides sp.]
QLLRVVVTEIPLSTMNERRAALRRHIQDLGSVYLSMISPDSRARVATRTWVVVAAMEGLALRWVLEETGIAREELVEELTRLAESYLTGAG